MRESITFHVGSIAELAEQLAPLLADRLAPSLERTAAPLLVDSTEIARLVGSSPSTVDRLRRAGTIPSVLVGTSRRYCPGDVIAALARSEGANDGIV